MAAGYGHSLAVTSDGKVYAWGHNWQGELGIGSFEDSAIPVAVTALDGHNVVAIAAEYEHSVAVTNQGHVFGWGSNWQGELGNGTTENSAAPAEVLGLDGKGVIGASAGQMEHSLAVTGGGEVYAWGANGSAGLGTPPGSDWTRPAKILGLVLTSDPAYTPPGYQAAYKSLTLAPDMTGDGRGEVVGLHNSGEVHVWHGHPNGIAGTKVVAANDGAGKREVLAPGDLTSDGRADLVYVTDGGDLILRPGVGGGKAAPGHNWSKIGNGWAGWRAIPVGDLNGDGKADLLGIEDATGDLYAYRGLGNGAFGTKFKVGNGWKDFDLYSGGDLNGDKKGDILGVEKRTGNLFAYTGKGLGFFNTKIRVGQGWGQFTLAGGGDLGGDGLADLVGRDDSDGKLYYYRGLGGARGFATKKQVGTGW